MSRGQQPGRTATERLLRQASQSAQARLTQQSGSRRARRSDRKFQPGNGRHGGRRNTFDLPSYRQRRFRQDASERPMRVIVPIDDRGRDAGFGWGLADQCEQGTLIGFNDNVIISVIASPMTEFETCMRSAIQSCDRRQCCTSAGHGRPGKTSCAQMPSRVAEIRNPDRQFRENCGRRPRGHAFNSEHDRSRSVIGRRRATDLSRWALPTRLGPTGVRESFTGAASASRPRAVPRAVWVVPNGPQPGNLVNGKGHVGAELGVPPPGSGRNAAAGHATPAEGRESVCRAPAACLPTCALMRAADRRCANLDA